MRPSGDRRDLDKAGQSKPYATTWLIERHGFRPQAEPATLHRQRAMAFHAINRSCRLPVPRDESWTNGDGCQILVPALRLDESVQVCSEGA
ncbi:MAG: hypothetical protein ACLPKW_07495, partial [Acetobacteraceae bacterium]